MQLFITKKKKKIICEQYKHHGTQGKRQDQIVPAYDRNAVRN